MTRTLIIPIINASKNTVFYKTVPIFRAFTTEIAPGFTFAIHRPTVDDKRQFTWMVSEVSTGATIYAGSETWQDAKEAAIARLIRAKDFDGEDFIKKAIARTLKTRSEMQEISEGETV